MPVTECLRRRQRAPTRVISHPSSQRPGEPRPDIPQGEDGCREHRTGAAEEREVQAGHEVRAVQRPEHCHAKSVADQMLVGVMHTVWRAARYVT